MGLRKLIAARVVRLAALPRVMPPPAAARDWAAGDVARCIKPASNRWGEFPTGQPGPGPSDGQLLRVCDLFADHPTFWLCFAAFPGVAYAAGHFRKLRPCSSDFLAQLVRSGTGQAIAPGRTPELVP